MPTRALEERKGFDEIVEYRNEYNSYPLGYSTHVWKAPHDDVEAIGIVK
jgi:hypothetical protein